VINHGVLQQIDTPQTLYDTPANKFVAGFIGSPAMNFFEAKIVKEGGDLFVNGDSFKIKIPKDKKAIYDGYAGKDIIFGIRPEDIHNPQYVPADITPESVAAKVGVTELMGNEIFAYLRSGSHEFIARVDPRSNYKFGDETQVMFNMENMHIFDKDSELAIR
jgi:multiple sugar transport system ATP-binding protein